MFQELAAPCVSGKRQRQWVRGQECHDGFAPPVPVEEACVKEDTHSRGSSVERDLIIAGGIVVLTGELAVAPPTTTHTGTRKDLRVVFGTAFLPALTRLSSRRTTLRVAVGWGGELSTLLSYACCRATGHGGGPVHAPPQVVFAIHAAHRPLQQGWDFRRRRRRRVRRLLGRRLRSARQRGQGRLQVDTPGSAMRHSAKPLPYK